MNHCCRFVSYLLLACCGWAIAPGHSLAGTCPMPDLAMPGPPFRVLADNDGADEFCVKKLQPYKQEVLLANIFRSVAIERTALEDIPDCPWPVYLYAYFDDDFDAMVGVSDPLEFSLYNEEYNIYRASANFMLDFEPFLDQLCGSVVYRSDGARTFTVTLAYRVENQYFPLDCGMYMPQPLFDPDSHMLTYNAVLCPGECNPDSFSPPSTKTDEETAALRLANANGSLPAMQPFSPTGTTVSGEGLSEIRVFPNPATDVVNIETPAIGEAPLSLFLYNNQGQLLLRLENIAGDAPQWQAIDLSVFPEGGYILQVICGRETKHIRLLKQK